MAYYIPKKSLRGQVNWWTAGGTDSCVVAYQPYGASSYNDSLANLVNPGTNDAVVAPSCNAPDWSADRGWIFDSTNTEALRVDGMTTNAQYSFIISLRNVDATPDIREAIGDAWQGIYPVNYSSILFTAQSGALPAGSELGHAILGRTPSAGYIQGEKVGTITTTGTLGRVMAIGTTGSTSTAVNTSRMLTGDIGFLAIFTGTLTDAQVAAITKAIQNIQPSKWYDSASFAYQPLRASSYAASKLNLSMPGFYDLSEGAGEVDWSNGGGWEFDGAKYLYNDFPNSTNRNQTLIVKYKYYDGGSSACLFGTKGSVGERSYIMQNSPTEVEFGNGNSVTQSISSSYSGVLAMNGTVSGWKDGVAIVSSTTGTGSPATGYYIGALNNDGSPSNYFGGYIQAVAHFKQTLTTSQIEAISEELLALEDGLWPHWSWGAIAAYQPYLADSYSESLKNIVNPGTYDAEEGTAPTWGKGVGWRFDGSSSEYLTIPGLYPGTSRAWTMLLRKRNTDHTALSYFVGARAGGQHYVALNGSTSYINCGNDSSIANLHSGTFSAEFWVLWGTGESYGRIMNWGSTETEGWAIIHGAGDFIRFEIYRSGSTAFRNSDTLTVGEWYHVAMCWNGSTMTCYINGALQTGSTNAGSGDVVTATGNFYMGGIGTWKNHGDGIAWARLSNNVRYTGAFTPDSKGSPPAVDANTIEQWNLNDGTGTTASAEVSSNNNGTIYNASWTSLDTRFHLGGTNSAAYFGQGGYFQYATDLQDDQVIGVAGPDPYLDGVDVGAISAEAGNLTYPLAIGAENNSGTASTFSTSDILSIAIWNRTLKASEVKEASDQMRAEFFPWWEAGGATGAVAVYQPKGASSYAASLADLSGNGNDAAEGAAPAWTSGTGWTFTAGSTHWLDTQIVAPNDYSYSMLIRCYGGSSQSPAFSRGGSPGEEDFGFWIQNSGATYFASGGQSSKSINATTLSVLGIAGSTAYKDGSSLGAISTGTGTENTASLTIGCMNQGGVRLYYLTGVVVAFVLYNNVLDSDEVSAVSMAMAAL